MDRLWTCVIALAVAVLAYGVASLLQAIAGRRHPDSGAAGLLRQPLVLAGLGLDVVGFGAAAVALHELPLFFVQSASSASILVTALLATLVLRERPDRREAVAMPLVLVGLVGLALAAEPGPATALPTALLVALGAAAPLFGLVGWTCLTRPGRRSSLVLAVLAGLSYGAASLAARGMSAADQSSSWLLPTGIVIALHALQGVVFVTAAMRRASVNSVTSLLFATETVGPAVLGWLLLGDRAAEGTAGLAVAGCVALVLATAVLSGGSGGHGTAREGASDVVVPAPRRAPDTASGGAHRLRPVPETTGRHAVGRHRPAR